MSDPAIVGSGRMVTGVLAPPVRYAVLSAMGAWPDFIEVWASDDGSAFHQVLDNATWAGSWAVPEAEFVHRWWELRVIYPMPIWGYWAAVTFQYFRLFSSRDNTPGGKDLLGLLNGTSWPAPASGVAPYPTVPYVARMGGVPGPGGGDSLHGSLFGDGSVGVANNSYGPFVGDQSSVFGIDSNLYGPGTIVARWTFDLMPWLVDTSGAPIRMRGSGSVSAAI